MRVVFLGTRGFPNVQGGVEKHCEYLSINLAKLNVEVIVFTRKPYIDTDIKFYKGVRLIPIGIFKHKYLEAFLHTFIGIFAALKYKTDILHIQGIGPAFFVPMAKILGMKIVLTSHGPNYKHLKWGKFARLFFKISEFFGIKSANVIITISETIANEIKEKYHKKAVVIPNGVPISKIITSDKALKKYNLNKKKYVLTVGRFVPEKGFDYLIDAYIRLELDGFKLVIVGDSDHDSDYSSELKKTANKNINIVLTGFISGKPLQELYSHAGLFVLPSYYEGLPIVLLEAMSYGLSCIVSDIEANRSVGLSRNRYFEPGDVAELTLKIKEYIKKPLNKYEKKQQLNIVARKYDWTKIAHSTLNIYKKLLTQDFKVLYIISTILIIQFF
jgi:glycosyltransferase involved in cell wall biosynthesis